MAKIYTKTGDAGETGLWGGRRVSKNNPRVRAYGAVDELNSTIGVAISQLPDSKTLHPLREKLRRIQEELFVLGTILATPSHETARLPEPFNAGIPPEAILALEAAIDRMTEDLEPMRRFILPGGCAAGAMIHLARTLCRRAEREVVSLREYEITPPNLVAYLNRLSDFLFTAARWINRRLKTPEIPWKGLGDERASKP